MVDTGVFFAYYSLRDKQHLDSLALIVHLVEEKWIRAFITNRILNETLNILKHRILAETARTFVVTFIGKNIVKIVHIEEELKTLQKRSQLRRHHNSSCKL